MATPYWYNDLSELADKLEEAWVTRKSLGIGFAVLIVVLVLTPAARAQQASGIAGVVRDAAGLAMPGVTVESASPALIEKVRTVTTDGEGRYNIVDLRPGTYTVTFTLTGFSTVKRDGVALGSGFTATVNITMSVGALEETITVSGAAPTVDTQTVRQQETLNTRDLESLPSGSIGLQTIAYMTPGFGSTLADVGGTRDTWSAQGAYTNYHGKTGTRAAFDGFRNQYFIGAASGVGYLTDSGTIDELQLETTGMGADAGSGSTNLNAIPRSGGNTLRGTFEGYYSNKNMQSSNLDETLRSFGITTAGEIQRIYRIGAQLGGPFVKDRLWFFAAVGRWGQRVNQPGAYFNPLQGQSGNPVTATLFYPGQPGTPYATMAPGGRPAAGFDWYRNHSLRTTWQATDRQRLNFFVDIQKSCRCTTGPFTGANAIEAERGWDWWPSGVVNATWTMPVTSRLLLEAGANWQNTNWVNFAETGVTRDDRSILETRTNYRYGAAPNLTAPRARTGRSTFPKFSMSYVTGTHNLKVGFSDEQGWNDQSNDRNHRDGLNYDFLDGKPIRLQYTALPYFQQERQNHEIGIFAQDAWRIRRLTLNLGLRFDYITAGFPAAALAAGPFVPARQVDELKGVPEWTDINPRLGVAYDVMGNGRTAVKASIGRFNQLSRSDMTQRFHPFRSSILAANRNWDDETFPVGDPRRGNYIPDCDLANFAVNGECGRISNENFGKFLPRATIFEDSVIRDNRDFLWDVNFSVDHEVTRGLSVSAGYNHNWDGNFVVTDNTLYGPEAFDEFCITVPVDPRLPTGGQELCGFYELQSQYFGRGVLRVTNSKEFGKQQRYWDGFVFSANGRLPRGITLGGGLDIGRQVDDHCYTVDSPSQPNDINNAPMPGGPFCRQVRSWANLADFRLRGSIPIRGGFNASFIYRNLPGAEQSATLAMAATSPLIRFKDPTRTRLNQARAVNLYAPNLVFGPRFNQLDVAVRKTFNVGVTRAQVALDVYNVLNGNSVQNVVSAFGTRWLTPTQFLSARVARITASINF